MSKFKTSIPVDVEAVKKLLPPGSHINTVVFNEKAGQVELHWEHDAFKTPFTFEQEFPVANLEKTEPPKGVKIESKRFKILAAASNPLPVAQETLTAEASATEAPVESGTIVPPEEQPSAEAPAPEKPAANVPTDKPKSGEKKKARK